MLINLQDFHRRDRRANEQELANLPDRKPDITSPARYEDIFSVDSASNFREVQNQPDTFAANLERWTFRMN
jgi:hypothetical protein